ncbi:MAG: hypothetical protein ACR2IE_04840 [Candidatus Sumerlaeaceae bacterium]
MRLLGLTILLLAAVLDSSTAQPSQSNSTGPSNTEPAATTTSPNGAPTGAALVPASGPAARTPDPGTRVGAGNTAPGLYTTDLVRTGDVLSSATAANPNGSPVIQNPGVRSGTLPRVKPDNTVSQTNLGANNTGTLNPATKTDDERNRAPISHPGSTSNGSAGTASGGTGSGTGR